MKSHALDSLLKIKDYPCISIILPMDPLNRTANYDSVESAVFTAKRLLYRRNELDEPISRLLDQKLERVLHQLPVSNDPGLGIFISKSILEIVTFPFVVRKKIIVQENFELRDLIYLKQLSEPYFVLNLTAHGVQLFRAVMDELEEIKDGKFPIVYKDEFEYQRASIASSDSHSLKGFEKEKSQISQIRLKGVWRQTNLSLTRYLHTDTKLIIAGAPKFINAFLTVTIFEKNIFAHVPGSFSARNFRIFHRKCRDAFMVAQRAATTRRIRSLSEKNNGHLAKGLVEVWNAAVQGKGRLLVLEKDFKKNVFQRGGEIKLSIKPDQKDYQMNPDAVDDLLKLVRQKDGGVIFAENDDLKKFGHIAMELRY